MNGISITCRYCQLTICRTWELAAEGQQLSLNDPRPVFEHYEQFPDCRRAFEIELVLKQRERNRRKGSNR